MKDKKTLIEGLEDYFANTSEEQIKKDWEETLKWDKVGISNDEFIDATNDYFLVGDDIENSKIIKNDIKEPLVGFEVARLLKEAGFKVLPKNTRTTEYIWGFEYDLEDGTDFLKEWEFQWEDCECSHLYLRPTQQMAVKWIKVNFNHDIEARLEILTDNQHKKYTPYIDCNSVYLFKFNTREDAIEAAIEYCLSELILKGNETFS